MNEKERLSIEVNNATMNFVKAIRIMVKARTLPLRKSIKPFDYTFELLEWVFAKPQILQGDEIVEACNPSSGEELAMSIAIDLEHILCVLSIPIRRIPEWLAWEKACDAQDKFLRENKK